MNPTTRQTTQLTNYKEDNHIISSTGNGLICNCIEHKTKGSDCEHILVELEKIKRSGQGFKIMERKKFNLCKFCNSGNLKKDGIRKCKKGNVQRFKCLDCKKRFSDTIGFEKMKYNDIAITRSLTISCGGLSYRDIADHFEQEGISVSHVTVYNWIKKYGNITSEYMKGIVPRVSETWRTDEIFIKISGEMKLQYTMMDHSTRYMITKLIANTKGTENVTPMFREAMMIAGKIPTTLISDGAANFHEAWKDNYKAKNFLWKDTEHIRHIHMKGDRNNNRMERLNGTIRDREIAFRGIKKMSSPFFDLFQVFYNCTKKHGGLDGNTPASKAGIEIEGMNKWKTLIQNASLNQFRN